MMSELEELEQQISLAMRKDRHSLRQRMRSMQSAARGGRPFDRNLRSFRRQLDESRCLRRQRLESLPRVDYAGLDLPVIARREDIAAALREHQVVIICGETGSGKSTQLPKIALEIGQGTDGMIGHTQPRRIAARSIAARIADELGSEVGADVGFKVRFADVTGPGTYIKLMTDGILLAETAGDRFLNQYDTIIIDEAHERSLNIDFLLGYLRRLLPKRRDLKVIITSATIDAERFQEHFATPETPVPIIEVSGRTYPVEVRYRPPGGDDGDQSSRSRDWQDGVLDALDEVCSEGPGDVLVFLPTERDIREISRRMRGRVSGAEVLPLYGRLSAKDQARVFAPSKVRRVVLATNVAESSVTVPGIRFVIDTGTARISRYSSRSRIQRLPIEAVSRASADQRKGRCGRVGPGICVRLYDESDFLKRDEYTQPEILRSNLASVILRSKALKLGAVEEFPFVDPPRPATIRDGYRTLFEIGAVDDRNQLTDRGRTLSKLPVDPRIGRMILAGIEERCLREVLVIASVLEIQDPRDRPVEKQEQADEAHQQFRHDESDFLTLLNIWKFFHEQKRKLSHSRLRKACLQNFLNWNRMREWVDLNRQLRDLIERSDDPAIRENARGLRKQTCEDYDAVHRALLTGLLAGTAFLSSESEYTGADQIKLIPWPGSVLFGKKPKWFVAAELVETHRRYARTLARINPNWIEPLAGHLVKKTYSEPHWHEKSASVMAFEKVALFGMPVVARRRTGFAAVDPEQSREIFIRRGLIEGAWQSTADFLVHNRALIDEVSAMQAKTRRVDLTPDDEQQYEFYDRLVPRDVCSGPKFDKWRKRTESRQPKLLYFPREDFLREEDPESTAAAFPDSMQIGENRFTLTYNMDLAADDDGITIAVPRSGLAQLPTERLGWLVPGLLEEKVVGLIKSLPKELRRRLVPAPDTARDVVRQLTFGDGDLNEQLARLLTRVAGDTVTPNDFDLDKLPAHLRIKVDVVDDDPSSANSAGPDGKPVAAPPVETAADWTREGLTDFDLPELPTTVELVESGMPVTRCPVLEDAGEDVRLTLVSDATTALHRNRGGLRRLFAIRERNALARHLKQFPGIGRIRLVSAAIPNMEIDQQLTDLLADRSFFRDNTLPRSSSAFEERAVAAANRLSVAVQESAALLPGLFDAFQNVSLKSQANCPQPWRAAFEDVRRQLARMIQPGFLVDTPWPWLIQVPRYLKAVQHRLDRLSQRSLQGDQRGLREIADFEGRCFDRMSSHAARGLHDPQLVAYRWMLEEYRVSLFAQKLGTAVPVSAKRLDRQWKKVSD